LVTQAGYDYFLEIDLALEVLEVLEGRSPSPDQKFELVLFYAKNDAFPDWVYDTEGDS
jgi:hypothetical protein